MKATPPILWEPTSEEILNSHLTQFIQHISKTYQKPIANFKDLHDWSIHSLEDFWKECAQFFKIPFHDPPDTILERGPHMTESRWFAGATLNYSEALLQKRDETPALITIKENGETKSISFNDLYHEVRALHFFLKSQQIAQGDVVSAYLPNGMETLVGLLATASLGAVWTSCSPDFGSGAVSDRFIQVQPKILLTCNAYYYKGKTFSMQEKVCAVLKTLPSVKTVLEVAYIPEAGPLDAKAMVAAGLSFDRKRWLPYETLVANWKELTREQPVEFKPLPFDHPLYILYSSGTTGLPKCIVHRAGGSLLKHLSELGLHLNLMENEKLLFFTTCGWMMWNWKVSALALGVTLVLYDGSPFYPTADRLLTEISTHQINVLGAGAAYYAQLKNSQISKTTLKAAGLNLTSLRMLLATGSPLTGDLFDYLMETLTQLEEPAKRLQICSISGGTDIVGCFVLGCPLLPVYHGEIQAPALGVALQIFNTEHKNVLEEKGELVCTQPFPSMPLAFFDDPQNTKYKDAYFHTLPEVWFHGDFAEITSRNSVIIHGRSDTVLNPGGVRIGTAEIYKHLEAIPEILESAAVTYETEAMVHIILFVVLDKQTTLTKTLAEHISKTLKEKASPRHVPYKIIAIADLPRTVNGKISEKSIKNVINNRPVPNANTLANPQALELFKNLKELKNS